MNNYTTTETLLLIAGILIIIVVSVFLIKTCCSRLSNQQKAEEAYHKEMGRLIKRQKWIMNLPIEYRTKEEIKALPMHSKSLGKSCPLNTWFLFKQDPDFPDYIIIGQVVDGCDALSYQAGGCATSLPITRGSGIRFTNHYRVLISPQEPSPLSSST